MIAGDGELGRREQARQGLAVLGHAHRQLRQAEEPALPAVRPSVRRRSSKTCADRGLLETTLVVATGEFGRTPKIGQIVQNGMTEKTGRDHWPHAFTVLLAGGGVRGGQVYGATDANGGYVKDKPVSPADLSATIFWHLGIDASQSYFDEFQRIEQQICEGRPIRDL